MQKKKIKTVTSRKSPPKKGNSSKSSFTVVGIGGSAGGLEAFTRFIENLSPSLGMAYIFIPHLSPDFKSMIPEILEKKTPMKIYQVKNKMKILQNNVYVIPPGNYMNIVKGVFELVPRIKRNGIFYSIDYFFSSLASSYQSKAIGIILSGTATDGTLGLKAIKANGGITFAQDESAKYEGMPKSAINAGYVDFILPPEKIAAELANIDKHPFSKGQPPNVLLEDNSGVLKQIEGLLLHKKRIDFSHYKKSTIHRRIMRRMLLNSCKNLKEYSKFLKKNENELELLYQDLLIHVTSFFRDPLMLKVLSKKVFPAILKNKKPGDILRVWVPGCATGEEAYSLAICLMEYLISKSIHNLSVQIFPTDLNEASIGKARTGVFSSNELSNMSPKRLKQFFVKYSGGYQIVKSIRDICVFATHNLLRDPPFSQMDIISCQNVLIYLEPNAQSKILQAFHYGLKPQGFLLLGKSETTGNSSDLFSVYDKGHNIYTKKNTDHPVPVNFQVDFNPNANSVSIDKLKTPVKHYADSDVDREINKILLSKFVPASLVVNQYLEIIQFRGSTSKFLNPSSGRASLNLLKMVTDDLAYDLGHLISKAKKEGKTQKKEGLPIMSNGRLQNVNIVVQPFTLPSKQKHFLIVFNETAGDKDFKTSNFYPPAKQNENNTDKKILALEKRLIESRDQVKVLNEEFEGAREELQSSNEEILSSNEELQSINEELETSKEELQSSNEELTTTNEELQNRNVELRESRDFSQAMVETIHESLIVLNLDFRVVKANRTFYKTFNLKQSETEGNLFYEIGNSMWNIPELKKQFKVLLPKNPHSASFELEHSFQNIGHKILVWNVYQLNLKDENRSMILLAIDDITEYKLFQLQLKESEEKFRTITPNAFDIITILESDGKILYQSPALEINLGYKPKERIGKNILTDSIAHPEDKHLVENFFNQILKSTDKPINAEFRLQHKNGNYKIIEARGINQLRDPRVQGLIITYRDVTLQRIQDKQKDEFISIASHELKTPVATIKAYTEILMNYFQRNNDTKAKDYLSKLESQIDNITSLINELLDVSMITEGRMEFKKDNYEINKLIREVSGDMQSTTKKHHLILKLGKETNLHGDRNRTGQILTNLLSNAIKYSPDHNEIVIKTFVSKKEIKIGIIDYGIGIEKVMREKIFERFIRITSNDINTYPGIGLGLFIAHEMVVRQGGRIWVEDNKKKGSKFYFTLPVN
ncbi:MAG: PAS domain S-box protein [Ignavibacteria bacterium]|nr:PAS domain S-box protein [Ignavibacteria bacterium]